MFNVLPQDIQKLGPGKYKRRLKWWLLNENRPFYFLSYLNTLRQTRALFYRTPSSPNIQSINKMVVLIFSGQPVINKRYKKLGTGMSMLKKNGYKLMELQICGWKKKNWQTLTTWNMSTSIIMKRTSKEDPVTCSRWQDRTRWKRLRVIKPRRLGAAEQMVMMFNLIQYYTVSVLSFAP